MDEVSEVSLALDEAANYFDILGQRGQDVSGDNSISETKQEMACQVRWQLLITLVRRCLDELWDTCSQDQTRGICECGSPLRLEELEQHRVGVEPLSNCLCHLGREGQSQGARFTSGEQTETC